MFEKVLAFFVTGAVAFDIFIMETNFLYSIIAGVVVGLASVLVYNYLQGDYSERTKP